MDVTRESTSRTLELGEILLSFQTGFNNINAAVVCACAVLKSISGFEPSSVTTEPRYLKLVPVSSFSRFTLMSVLFYHNTDKQPFKFPGLAFLQN